ncbi:hypothetical protein H6G81_29880 [Scytonema hofmannii FACHB-248]|uniref:Uncharacterized protein n=1 Tax=Scytonema hofmannii FACHB-248 TaxID=1842502 RepID=A0ABR8H035_9CYAN|nr:MULTISPECIES: hypothetical protein [Nostocales]MBD2608615.1 hypothetical protein [Scytonema hofmannii FACHB-248]
MTKDDRTICYLVKNQRYIQTANPTNAIAPSDTPFLLKEYLFNEPRSRFSSRGFANASPIGEGEDTLVHVCPWRLRQEKEEGKEDR